MKKISFFLFSFFFSLFSFLIPVKAAVQTEVGPVNNVTEYVSNILDWLIPLLGGLALLMFIYASYIYITSQGNPESIGKAKDIIIGVLTGILLLFLIKVILNQIGI